MNSDPLHIKLEFIDYLVIAIYFAFVIAVGYRLKKYMVSSKDFLLAGKSIPTWATGIAFMAANLGAIEVMGMTGMVANYGILTAHFYWIGAIPAMVFLALFMMPIYYGSNVRSVPEYLQKRFNEHTRAFNAVSFAVMTVLMSGINLYAMALVLQSLFQWDMNLAIFLAAGIVLAYTFLGGLTSSIYNEVIQFFLIIAGILPLSILGLLHYGGWEAITLELSSQSLVHMWTGMGSTNNPLGVDWIGLFAGLGFVLSFGYWCTDFLVIQRAMAAKDLRSSQRTPLIAAFPKLFFPFITVLPGILVLVAYRGVEMDSNMMLPLLMGTYYPAGMLGLGLTALLASFMSGMAGNVTAFNTVWTYDIYQSYIAKGRSDRHYLWMARAATVGGILVSVGAAYLVARFSTIMDYMQMVFSFFNAPLLATFLLGMFLARTSPWGAFFGLVVGTSSAVLHYFFSEAVKIAPEYLPPYLVSLKAYWPSLQNMLYYKTEMAANLWRAVFAFSVTFVVTLIVTMFTKPKPKEELTGLIWSMRNKPEPLKRREGLLVNPYLISMVLIFLMIILNLCFV